MKRITGFLALILALLFGAPAQASVLSSAISATPTGTFTEIPDVNMPGFNNGTIFSVNHLGCNLGDTITQFSNRAVWNTASNKFQYVGAPHGSAGCNDSLTTVIYDEATSTWSIGPKALVSNTAHAYDHNAMNSAAGTHYYRQYNSVNVYQLPDGGSSWSQLPDIPMASHDCCSALEWFPDQGRLIFVDGDWGGWSYNPGTNSWTHLFRTNGDDGSGLPQYPMTNNEPFSVYSNLGFLFFGENVVYKMNAAGTVTALGAPPFGDWHAGPGGSGLCCSHVMDPATGHIVIIDGSRNIWDLNPTTNAYTNVGVAPAYFGINGGPAEGLVSASISDYGAIMYVKCDGTGICKVFVYKHGAGTPDTTAPTAPSGLVATAVSGTQINLTWTASTDNVAVTGYNVERCQGAACSPITQVYTPLTNSQNDTGLTGSTTYRYRVRAHDNAGNLSGYSATVGATTAAPDTTAPTAPTNLALTVISSSQIDLTWTVSTDAVGVTAYNVERSPAGCATFVEVATPSPNSYSNTGLSASTLYCFRVRAHDAAGNLSSYSAIQQATTQVGGSGGSDFAARCAAPGVLRCMGFDDPADLFIGNGGGQGAWGYNYGFSFSNGDYSDVSIDTGTKSNGASALRFQIPGNKGNNGGAYFLNFTNPASTYQVGEGQDVYIQWRQRLSPEMVNTVFWGATSVGATITLGATSGSNVLVTATGGTPFGSCSAGGTCVGHSIYFTPGCCVGSGRGVITSVIDSSHVRINVIDPFDQLSYNAFRFDNGLATYKLADISAGDKPTCDPNNPGTPTCPSSCREFTAVTTNHGEGNMPTGYANCEGQNAYQGFYGSNSPSGLTYQNVVDCPYPGPGIAQQPPVPCFPLVANEWLTFQVHLHVGNWNVANSTYQLWAAREGQPSTLIIECSPTVASPHKCVAPYTTGVNWYSSDSSYKFGKVYFLPYMTDKSPYQSHNTGYIWYDEVVISSAKIADPSTAPADTTIPTVAITSPIPPTTSTTTSPISVSGTATDNIGVTSVTWTCIACATKGGTATGPNGSTSVSWVIPALDFVAAGSYIVNVVSHDAAGNVSTAAPLTITYTPTPSYWVNASSSGSHCVNSPTDPGVGSSSQTITQGLACVGAAGTQHGGQKVYVKAGTYVESLVDVIPSGSSGSMFTLQCVTDLACSINPSGNNSQYAIEVGGTGMQWVTIRGFKSTTGLGFRWSGGSLTTAHDVWILNNEIDGTVAGTLDFGMTMGGASNFIIRGNNVHHLNGCAGLCHGIYLTDLTNNFLIDGNTIHDNGAYGLQFYANDQTSMTNHIVKNNVLYRNGLLHSSSGSGMVLYGTNYTVYNNVSYNNDLGGILIRQGTGVVYSNTVYNNPEGGIYNDSDGNQSVTCANNLSIANGPSGAVNVRNCTASTNVTTGTAASHFTSAATGNFTLTSGSTANNVGANLGPPYNVDITNAARPASGLWDAGAYEFVTSNVVVTIVNPTSQPTLGVASPLFSLGGTSNLP